MDDLSRYMRVTCLVIILGSVYFAGTGYGNIFTIVPALAVGCTGKGQFGISSRLHWEGSIWH